MYTIGNEILKVAVSPSGAQLESIFNKQNNIEYLWSGDAKFWGKKSPVLFPIVGTLKDNRYFFNGKPYQLGRHGFAREKMFTVTEQTTTAVSFELRNDDTTLDVFPFRFIFSITYAIDESSLSVTYLVKNPGEETMFFSVGGHPAFKLPIAEGPAYNDYYLLFNKTENAARWPIDAAGLIEAVPVPLLQNTARLPLSKSLFYADAIVLKGLESDEVQVKSDSHTAGFSFSFKGFPYLGIWAAKNADFVCIEPWCGIADSVHTSQVLKEKEGIVNLAAGAAFERTWKVTTW